MAGMIPLRDGDRDILLARRLERAERRAEIRAELEVLSAEIETCDRGVWTLPHRITRFRLTQEYRTLLIAVLAVAAAAAFTLALVLISRSDHFDRGDSGRSTCSLHVCVKSGHVLNFDNVQPVRCSRSGHARRRTKPG